jgi:glycine oxidase
MKQITMHRYIYSKPRHAGLRYIGGMGLQSTHVHVAGAGIIGLSIAWKLAKAGARVHVYEAETAGSGATEASAGMLAPGGEFDRDEPLLHLAQAALKLWPDFAEELRGESGMPVDYIECGAVERPADDAHWKELVRRARRQQELGIACDIADGELFYPGDCIVDPHQLVPALRRACEARKVEIREREPLRRIDAGEGVPTVIAAGCWSNQIEVFDGETQLQLPAVKPVKGHLLGYRMPAGSLPHILRSGSTYILQRAGGYTVAGSTKEDAGFNTAVDPAICQDIHERACRLWPRLCAHRPAECWTGLRPAADTEDPIICRLDSSSVWLAYGHFRNGILLAPVTAELIAAQITASLGRG